MWSSHSVFSEPFYRAQSKDLGSPPCRDTLNVSVMSLNRKKRLVPAALANISAFPVDPGVGEEQCLLHSCEPWDQFCPDERLFVGGCLAREGLRQKNPWKEKRVVW